MPRGDIDIIRSGLQRDVFAVMLSQISHELVISVLVGDAREHILIIERIELHVSYRRYDKGGDQIAYLYVTAKLAIFEFAAQIFKQFTAAPYILADPECVLVGILQQHLHLFFCNSRADRDAVGHKIEGKEDVLVLITAG